MKHECYALIIAALVTACGDDGSSATTDDGSSSSTTTDTTATSSTTSGSTTDPTTSTTTSTTSTSGPDETTGGAGACGNELVEVGEDCDEGADPDPWARCLDDCSFGYIEDWTVSYDGPASSDDAFVDVAIDAAGNIYVAGNHSVALEARNLVVKQYAPDGTEGWTYEYNGTASSDDFAASIELHPSGDLIVAGGTTGMGEGRNLLTLRLTADGQTATWIEEYNGPGTTDSFDGINAVAVDSSGNVIVAGVISVDDQELDGELVRYDADGSELGTTEYNGAGSLDDSFVGVAAVSDGFVALRSEELSANENERRLVKYDASGNEVDDVVLDFTARSLTADDSDNIIVTGNSQGDSGDIVFVSHDSSLTEQWRASYNGPSSNFDFGLGVRTDAEGASYVAGAATVVGQADDLWLGKVDASGAPQWSMRYNNEEASLSEFGESVAIGSDGTVVVVGSEVVLGQSRNGFLRRLTQP